MARGAFGLGRRNQPLFGGEGESERHADGDCFAMQKPAGKAARRLEGMAERMAEIKKRTVAGLALVAGDDVGLGAAAHGDGMSPCWPAAEDLAPIVFQPREERRVAEQSIFGDFGIAGAEFALRQSVETRG